MPEPALDEESQLVAAIAEGLVARHEMLAVAESAAGGRISDLLTDRPGSSAWFAGAVVAYSGQSKEQLAGGREGAAVPASAVSPETAAWLADAARHWFRTDWGIGETGITGPQTGRRSRKPAGLAYVAVRGPDQRLRVAEITTNQDNRVANKLAFAVAALRLLLEELRSK